MKRPKRPEESEPGSIFQNGSSPTNSKGIDLSYSYRTPWLNGQHEPEFDSAGWWQKPTRRARCKQCAQCRVVKELDKGFRKMQVG